MYKAQNIFFLVLGVTLFAMLYNMIRVTNTSAYKIGLVQSADIMIENLGQNDSYRGKGAIK